MRIDGPGHGTVEVDGERIIFASTALPIAAGKNWSVLITVPEREIIGFVAANNRTALLLSLSIIGIAALLAALLVRQGIRADRNARLVRERQENIEAQSRAFASLANSASLFDPEIRAARLPLPKRWPMRRARAGSACGGWRMAARPCRARTASIARPGRTHRVWSCTAPN